MAHLEVISIRIPPLREYAEDVRTCCATTWIAWWMKRP
jgi:DNA-binding NtrC family response regulator